jgi:tetratricopeptide (TPR) repeat protein
MPTAERKHLLASDIGEAYYKLGNRSKALEYFYISLKSEDTDNYLTKDIYKILSDIFFYNKDYQKAYSYLRRYLIMNDSILNNQLKTENVNKVAELQKQYDFAEIEKEYESQAREKDLLHAVNEKQQRIYIFFSAIILLIVILFSVIIYRKYKTSQLQKKIIEHKNKEVMDSIHYAKRIQSSMLPTEKYIEKSINKY